MCNTPSVGLAMFKKTDLFIPTTMTGETDPMPCGNLMRTLNAQCFKWAGVE